METATQRREKMGGEKARSSRAPLRLLYGFDLPLRRLGAAQVGVRVKLRFLRPCVRLLQSLLQLWILSQRGGSHCPGGGGDAQRVSWIARFLRGMVASVAE